MNCAVFIDTSRTAAFVAALQQPDGSFAGDEWLEIDTRFSYCALSCLVDFYWFVFFLKKKFINVCLQRILNSLELVDVPKAGISLYFQ